MTASLKKEQVHDVETAPLFSVNDFEAAKAYFDKNGFVSFHDLLNPEEIESLRDAAEEAYPDETGILMESGVADNRDMMFTHPLFEKMAKDERFWGRAKELLGVPIELQHTKYNAKLPEEGKSAMVVWHQDFPFFPQSNFDMIAGLIHIDEEKPESGALTFIPGSHKWGVQSHCEEGEFKYGCTEIDPDSHEKVALCGPQGVVSFHHGLSLHGSGLNHGENKRRFLIYQFRAQDAVQLSGVLWKSTGYQVEPEPSDIKGTVRFPDGTRVENRGKNGRLYDVYGQLAPDK